MVKKVLLLILFTSYYQLTQAQWITHGPVTGGVSDSAVNLFLRCDAEYLFTINLDTDSLFSSPLAFPNTTDINKDFSAITQLTGLLANTKYYYRINFPAGIDVKKGSFTTFPEEGEAAHFTFVAGSCQETPNMKVFDVIPTHNPLFMVHSGDYTYPSYQLPSNYPQDWNTLPLSYRKRYEEAVMKDKLLPYVPLVYMPDDDDNFGISRTYHLGTSYSGTFPNIQNFIDSIPITEEQRVNCLRAYRYFFPGYATVDTTEGHYHSFKVANAEFFVTDCRSMADPWSEAYQFDSITGIWSFNPSPNHSILGDNQMNWLLNGLSASTAKWKFIVSGVPFNPKYTQIIQAVLPLQGYVFDVAGQQGTGFRLSTSFADGWGGFPNDVAQLISHVENEQINNVMVISGQTHHNVMDDGTNSYFPELNASGLSVSSTELAYQMNLNAPLFGQPPVVDSLWNSGGNGLFNTNFLNGFGKVEVYGADSVKMCIIDEDNVALSCMTVYSDGTVSNNVGLLSNGYLNGDWDVYPNPASSLFYVRLDGLNPQEIRITMQNNTGEFLAGFEFQSNSLETTKAFSIPETIPNGIYWLKIQGLQGSIALTKKLVVLR